MADGKASGGVQSVERAFSLLERMAELGDLSLTELSATIGLPSPTTHRLLKTLVSMGYVRQLPNRRYGLGIGLVRLADRVDTQFAPIAKPHLELLARTVGESANLAVLEGTMVVYIAQAPSPHPMRMFTEVGRRVHPHSTGVGKAILAQLGADKVRRIVDRAGMPAATDRTITDPDKLTAELDRIRRQGYARDNGEHEEGVCCYAVPVPGVPISMAISVSGPQFRMTKEVAKIAVPLLQAEAAAFAQELLGVAG